MSLSIVWSWLPVLVSSILITIATLWVYMTNIYQYWHRRNIPFLKPLPVFGNFLPVLRQCRSAGAFFDDCYNSVVTPVIGLFIFARPYLLVRDPELIKAVLVKDFAIFSERFFTQSNSTDAMGTHNLFALNNPHWRAMRAKLTPTFTSGRIRQMLPLVLDVGQRLTQHVRNDLPGRVVDIKELSAKYSTDVIASCAFGLEANSFVSQSAELRNMGKLNFTYTRRRSLELVSCFFLPLLTKLARFALFKRSCAEFIRNVIYQTIEAREVSGIARPDLIETLIKLKNEDSQLTNQNNTSLRFEGDTIVAQGVIFFFAGFDTSAGTMSFTLFHLAVDIELQTRVRSEILKTLAANDDKLTYECISEMKLLDMCVKETLRKYPILPFLNRDCQQDYTFPGTDINIAKGTAIVISASAVQNDPEYFPEPERYMPERFSDENKQNIRPFTYLPFGEGPHSCIGVRFGLFQVKVGLIHVLKECQVSLAEEMSTEIKLNPRALFLTTQNKILLRMDTN